MALISGGSGDLAQAIAQQLSSSGWAVHAPSREELDVTNLHSIREYVSTCPDTISLLINNAGALRDGPFLRLDAGGWDAVLDSHLRGTFLLTRELLPRMVRKRSGHVIQIGSFSALQPPSGQSNYAAAKAALIGFTQALASEYGERNLRFNCVLPGFLPTKMTQSLPSERIEEVREQHVLKRFNTPEDVARFIEFLHSLENVSGQVFQLDSRLHRWT